MNDYLENKSKSFRFIYEGMSKEDILAELKADAKTLIEQVDYNLSFIPSSVMRGQVKVVIRHLKETEEPECVESAMLLYNTYHINR